MDRQMDGRTAELTDSKKWRVKFVEARARDHKTYFARDQEIDTRQNISNKDRKLAARRCANVQWKIRK